jgi:hypothetical protein
MPKELLLALCALIFLVIECSAGTITLLRHRISESNGTSSRLFELWRAGYCALVVLAVSILAPAALLNHIAAEYGYSLVYSGAVFCISALAGALAGMQDRFTTPLTALVLCLRRRGLS